MNSQNNQSQNSTDLTPNVLSSAVHMAVASNPGITLDPNAPPSSKNPIAFKPSGFQFKSGEPVTPADSRKIVEGRILDESKIYKGDIFPQSSLKTSNAAIKSFASNTVQGPASIVELARALKNDPQLIFEFVYNNIEWEPGWGVQKGALGCLLDGMGNAFDQSMLLVALLRQAGYTANYVLGTIQLSEAQFDAWFNTTSIWAAYNYCNNENIPAQAPTWNGSIYQMVMSHVWVQVVVSGTTYVLDSSYKTYTRTAPVANLATILGYNAATFLADAESGATIDVLGNYVQNMNKTNISADLTTMTSNLTTWIKSNKPDATVDDILGGQQIVPITLPFTWNTSLSYEAPGDVPTIWTGDVPLAYKTTLQVQFPLSTGGWSIDQTFTSDQLAGGRLTLLFNGSLQPVLYLNGTAIAIGEAQSAGTWNSVLLTVTHNAYSVPWYNQQWWQGFIWAGQYYLIGNAWGNLGSGQADFHVNQLAANTAAAGASSTSEPVVGEKLSSIWFKWASQTSKATDLIGRIMNCHLMYNHQVGIVSYNNGGSGAFATDIGGVSGSSTNLNNDTTKTPINDTVVAMHGVALEAAALAQASGLTPGVSTTTVIDAANTAGNRIYKGTSSNWNTGVNVSATLIANGYSSTDMTNIYNWYISAGDSVVLGDNPSLTLGSWSGWGDWIYPSSGAYGLINGNFKGSEGQPTYNIYYLKIFKPGDLPAGQPTSSEPIGLFSGDFFYSRTDIILGSQPFPYSLEFGRSYSSSNQYQNGVLGWGWTHNHDITASVNSDGMLAMGDLSAAQGAASIAEFYVCTDLLADTSRPVAKLVTASLADKWWIDQIVNNIVAVSLPGKKQVYVKQPDGSYTAPSNFPSSLTLSAGAFTLTTPEGVQFIFNTSGQISSFVFPSGGTVTYTYSAGLLSTISNGMGRILTLNYTSGKLTSVTDGTGRSVQYGFDGNESLSTFTDATSQSITYQYDQPGRLTQVFLPLAPATPIVTNVYDSLSRVKTQSNARNQQWSYYFAGSRTEEVDPIGNSSILYFNRLGLTTRAINALGFETDTQHDGLGRPISVVLPEGNKVQMTYDANNNILTKTFIPKPASGLSDVQFTYTYDPTWAKLKTVVDGNGETVTYGYDPSTGNLLTVTKPMVGGQTPQLSLSYNSRGQIATITDETGIVTKMSYDVSTEKLTSVVADYSVVGGHLNLTTSFGYDAVGNVNSVTDPNTNQTTFVFDNERRLTQSTSPAPFNYVTNWVYNVNGNLVSTQRQVTSAPTWQTTSIGYTITDKVYTVTDTLGRIVLTNTYDGADRLQTATDAQGRLYQYAYDALNRLSTVTDPSNTISDTETYTNNGLRKATKDASNNLTQYAYDGFDRPSVTTFADTSTIQFNSYDGNGNLLNVVTRSGNAVSMTYDSLNRLSTKSPAGQATVTYGYDLANRPISVSKPTVVGDPSTGIFQKLYDTAGRFYQEQYPDGKTVTHVLDSNGNRTRTTWPDGYYITRAFDQLNRLTNIYLNGSASPSLTYNYDQLSRRASVAMGNGASTSYSFSPNNDLVSQTNNFVGSSNSYSLGYNNIHQLVGIGMSDSSFVWHPVGTGTVGYGAADSVNKYPSVGAASFTYDGNKNLTFDGTWTYSYDTENHLLSAVSGGVTANYFYDPLGRQAQKTVNATPTRFIYDGLRLIATYDGGGNLVNRYVHGPGVDEPSIQVTAAGVTSFFHRDFQGSVVAITDNLGAVLNKYVYSPFGESAALNGTIFGYTGQRYDSETGLYYYKARHYSPGLGRFLQPDPIGYAGGDLNLYAYVGNDPLNRRDPLGLTSQGNNGSHSYGGNGPGDYAPGWGPVDSNGNPIAPGAPMNSPGNSSAFDPGAPSNWTNPGHGVTNDPAFDPGAPSNWVNPGHSITNNPRTTTESKGGLFGFFEPQNPTPRFIRQGSGYSTYEEAVWAALTEANALSQLFETEAGGVIYRNSDGTFGYTVQIGTTNSVHIDVNYAPDGSRNWARYHSHGIADPGYSNEVFSDADINVSNSSHLNSWLVTPTNHVYFHETGSNTSPLSFGTLAHPSAP